MKFQKFIIWKISHFSNSSIIVQFKKFTNFRNSTISKIKKKFNFNIWKMNILQYQKLLNILGIQIISKK